MGKFSVALITCILLLSIAGSTFLIQEAHAATCNLTVTVLNEYNKVPIVDANVSISGPTNLLLVTDANGTVTFTNIPTGTYQVLTSAAEYPNQQAHTITLSGDQQILVLFGYTRAIFTYTPSNVTVNQPVAFNASQSETSGNMTKFNWDFGDNTTGTGMYVNHTYTNPGTFQVTLSAISTHGRATYTLFVPVPQNPSPTPWPFPWILLVIPFLIPIPIILAWRRRRYYVVIQARLPPEQKNAHCPGDGTKCENCKLTPC
jgi:PKD repeat protein